MSVRPGAPCSTTFFTGAGRSPQGVLRSNLKARARLGRITLRRYPLGSPQGRITPSRIVRLASPRTRSALTSRFVPRPEHSGQAPNGELNENCRGSSSGSESPHVGQARSEEHTSELQSQSNLVCRLLLEKKKKTISHRKIHHNRSADP